LDFSTVKSRLRLWLGDKDTTELPDSILGDIVNESIRQLQERYLPRYCEVSDTLALSADDREYAEPDRFIQAHTLWYTHPDNDSTVFLEGPLTKEQFDLNFPDSTDTALPEAYTIWGTNFQFGKTPDQSLTLNRNYYQYLADLSADADTNKFTDNHHQLVIFKSIELAAEYGFESALGDGWKKRAESLELDFAITHARVRSAGKRAEPEEPG
jgi:hypothetical protein